MNNNIIAGLITIVFLAGVVVGVTCQDLIWSNDDDCEFDVLVDQKFNYIRVDNVTGSAWLVQGYYVSPDYFCVKTKGRSFEAIAETTFHELAHHYATVEEEHFCGVKE